MHYNGSTADYKWSVVKRDGGLPLGSPALGLHEMVWLAHGGRTRGNKSRPIDTYIH